MKFKQIYHILKASEGGLGQKQALFDLKELGIKAKGTTSCYVGHTAIQVIDPITEEQHEQIQALLWGKVHAIQNQC